MDLQTLRFFVASADAGSFSAAAENLCYAQSNLSSRIKQLEEELGEPLFYRYKRGVSLTAKGKVFYDYAVRLLRLSEEAVTVMRDMEHAMGKADAGLLGGYCAGRSAGAAVGLSQAISGRRAVPSDGHERRLSAPGALPEAGRCLCLRPGSSSGA